MDSQECLALLLVPATLPALVLRLHVEDAESGLVSGDVVGAPDGSSGLCGGTMDVGAGCCSGQDQALAVGVIAPVIGSVLLGLCNRVCVTGSV